MSTPRRIGDRGRRATALVLLVTLVSFGLAVTAKSWCGIPGDEPDLYLRWCYSDIPPLYYWEELDTGAVPYVDHDVEYPVLTGAVMWFASVPSDDAADFFWWTVPVLGAAALAAAWLLAREVGWPWALAFAAAPTLALSGVVNWDLPAVALATLGLVLHRRGRDGWSGVALGLGAAAKLFPALFVLPTALAAGRLRGARAGWRSFVGAAGTWVLVNLPVALVAPGGWFEFFRLSRERPSDWDALSTVVLEVTGWQVATGTLNTLLLVAFLAGYGALLAWTVRHDPPRRWHLVCLPLLAWFLLASKVYSPQFSLWLLPLFALAFPGWVPWATFAVADVAVTLTRFRYLGGLLGDGGLDGAWPWWPFAVALVARAAVLAWVAWRGWRGPAPGQLAPTPRSPRVREGLAT